MVQSATSKELQLPAMSALTKKTSVQQCLLRTLNTILMLRDAKRLKESESRTINDGKIKFTLKFDLQNSNFCLRFSAQGQSAEPNAQRTNVDNDQNLVTIESVAPISIEPGAISPSPATAMEIDENGKNKYLSMCKKY